MRFFPLSLHVCCFNLTIIYFQLCRHFILHFHLMESPDVAMPAGPEMTFNSRSNEMIAQLVTFLIAWLAPQGEPGLQRCESAKEALNRAAQRLSVHGSWSWIPKMCCSLTRTGVGLQSEVARLDGIIYRSWDYHQPSRAVVDAIADMSYDTAVLWQSELQAAALFFDDIAEAIAADGQHAVWGTVRHAADGTRDLHDLIGIPIKKISPLPGP